MAFAKYIAALALIAFLNSANAASFYPMGDLPGGTFDSGGWEVSADGSVVVGFGNSTIGQEAIRWTSDGGMVGLGYLPGSDLKSEARAVSAHGSVVVGHSGGITMANSTFRWTNGSMVDLGTGARTGFGVSNDGSAVVGTGVFPTQLEAFRWTAGGGIEGLGVLPGQTSRAWGVFGDGAVVVGNAGAVAVRWTSTEGVTDLGALPSGYAARVANAANLDGSVVVGVSDNTGGVDGTEAFRWTADGGAVGLGFLLGEYPDSNAQDVSADGSVIVGRAGNTSFIWTAVTGMRSIAELATLQAVIPGGWQLLSAYGISDDGQTIVGHGVNPLGDREGWVVTLAPVPIPPAVWLFGSALGLLGWVRRKSVSI